MPCPTRIAACRWPQVDTPALLIDLDAFERNLERMADFVRKAGVRLRPHAKTHKSPDHRRQADGARRRRRVLPEGVGGRGDGGRRRRRRARLQRGGGRGASSTAWRRWRAAPRSACASTMPDNVAEIEAAAAKAGARLDVLVEIDVGARRCGTAPGRAGGAAGAAHRRARRTCALPACRPTTARPSTCARRPSARRTSPAPSRT